MSFQKKYDAINGYASSPVGLSEHISNNLGGLQSAAPNISQGLASLIARGVGYLGKSLPKKTGGFLLSGDHPIPEKLKRDFMDKYDVIDNPMSVLEHIHKGTLNGHHMEAMQSVYPELLKHLQGKMISKMNPETAKNLPRSVRISLAKFLGKPLDENMIPQSLIANQQSLQAPQLGEQSATPMSRSTPSMVGMRKLNLSSRAATRTQEQDEVNLK